MKSIVHQRSSQEEHSSQQPGFSFETVFRGRTNGMVQNTIYSMNLIFEI